MFQGYYKDEANTRDAVDAHGWLHTGERAPGAGRGVPASKCVGKGVRVILS